MKFSAFLSLVVFLLQTTAFAAPESQRPIPTADQVLASAGFKIDKAFTAKERRDLARGLSHIPVCLREKVRGLKILRANFDLYGERKERSDNIKINPRFFRSKNGDVPDEYYNDLRDGGFVHELFHAIGEWNNDYYYHAYLALDEEGECPVSSYGREKDIVQEDFSEAARILYVPRTGDDRLEGACVDAKLKKLKKIFDACK